MPKVTITNTGRAERIIFETVPRMRPIAIPAAGKIEDIEIDDKTVALVQKLIKDGDHLQIEFVKDTPKTSKVDLKG